MLMMGKKTISFRLPIELVEKLEQLKIDIDEFVCNVLKDAFSENKNNTKKLRQNYDDEFLNRYIDRLESDLEFWKEKYEVLQLEYYDQVRDSIKRLDSKFERVMYSIDESKQKPLLESGNQKQNDQIKKSYNFDEKENNDDFRKELDELIHALQEKEDEKDAQRFLVKKKKDYKKDKDSDALCHYFFEDIVNCILLGLGCKRLVKVMKNGRGIKKLVFHGLNMMLIGYLNVNVYWIYKNYLLI